MTLAILGLLSAVIPFGIWWIKRRIERNESPEEKNRRAYAEIDSDIATGDSRVASAHASDALDELDRLQRSASHSGGSDGNTR